MYVGRFAPSPTGPLHFGSLVAAVASYADARGADGRWLLRIEDVDTARCSKAAETAILRQLAAYGFEADGEVVRQSERGERYACAITRLADAGYVFACTCTRRMLQSATRNTAGEPIYPGTCRDAKRAITANALRLRVDADERSPVSFTDRIGAVITQNVAAEVGDFVLRRGDGRYAYQLAVVVDDAQQGVTDIVRGADLLMNTPRQIVLQRLLGVATPTYLHVPLVCNARGEKLSKQTRATAISIDSPLPTLAAAWAYLRQSELGRVDSVAAFWQLAISQWNPQRLRGAHSPS